MINVDVSVKNIMYVKKSYVWNAASCSCENEKYLARKDDSAIMYDEVIESYDEQTKTLPTNFNEKKATLLLFLVA